MFSPKRWLLASHTSKLVLKYAAWRCRRLCEHCPHATSNLFSFPSWPSYCGVGTGGIRTCLQEKACTATVDIVGTIDPQIFESCQSPTVFREEGKIKEMRRRDLRCIGLEKSIDAVGDGDGAGRYGVLPLLRADRLGENRPGLCLRRVDAWKG